MALLSLLLILLVTLAVGLPTHLRGRTDLNDYPGVGRAQPFAAAVLIVAMVPLVALHPLIS
ncbi:hypothetical protein [Vreelandella sulfidaeris]|uniref:hypothetical protein n=1 Tax=Vreelandella sulfidaeris TaxID=115553 RepID=UPI0035F0BF5B